MLFNRKESIESCQKELANWLLLYGSKPTEEVKLNTMMIKNLLDNITNKIDRVKMAVEVPNAFTQIKADDATFELTMSNTIQKLNLYHRSSVYKQDFENVVGKAIGAVFANSGSINLHYEASS